MIVDQTINERQRNVIINRCISNYNKHNKITDVCVNGTLSGKRCFIIAGGESVKNLNLNKLDNEIVITINIGFIAYPKSKFNYMMDSDLYDKILNGSLNERHKVDVAHLWREYSGKRIYLCPMEIKTFGPEVYLINRFREIDLSYDLNRGIHGADNSGYGALMLSIALGCREIYLLGYDMKAVSQTHWHKGYDDRNLEQFNSKLNEYRMGISAIAPRIATSGIKVYNCSRNSALTCFEYKDFNGVLDESNI